MKRGIGSFTNMDTVVFEKQKKLAAIKVKTHVAWGVTIFLSL